MKKEYVNLVEAVNNPSDYQLYHDSYSSAVQTALEVAKEKGYEVSDEEAFQQIGTGPAKPSSGKTNSLHLQLTKNGKPVKEMLHVQVYNRGTNTNPFELNMYVS
jgi:hypothetical protein